MTFGSLGRKTNICKTDFALSERYIKIHYSFTVPTKAPKRLGLRKSTPTAAFLLKNLCGEEISFRPIKSFQDFEALKELGLSFDAEQMLEDHLTTRLNALDSSGLLSSHAHRVDPAFKIALYHPVLFNSNSYVRGGGVEAMGMVYSACFH